MLDHNLMTMYHNKNKKCTLLHFKGKICLTITLRQCITTKIRNAHFFTLREKDREKKNSYNLFLCYAYILNIFNVRI